MRKIIPIFCPGITPKVVKCACRYRCGVFERVLQCFCEMHTVHVYLAVHRWKMRQIYIAPIYTRKKTAANLTRVFP